MEGGLQGRDLDATAFLDLTDRENLKYVFLLFGLLLIRGKADICVLLVSDIFIKASMPMSCRKWIFRDHNETWN